MKPGDLIRIRAAGTSDEWTTGLVAIGSGDGAAIGVLLQGMVRASGGFIGGFLPLNIDYEDQSVRSLFGYEYEIEVSAAEVAP